MKEKFIDNYVLELSQISTTLSNLADVIDRGIIVDVQEIILGCCNHIDRIVEDLNSYEK